MACSARTRSVTRDWHGLVGWFAGTKQQESGLAVSDQLLQQKTRCILYDYALNSHA